jgi:glycosyltransferase involved in cell wall biosynthesis
MEKQPILSICVPSRNRQIYFQQTISSLVEQWRPGIEFIFADNSDDASIMDSFMAGFANQPFIRYLPSPRKTLSVQDNFERVCDAAAGAFVSIIGDDDYIDTELVDLLKLLTHHRPELDCLAWSRPVYLWPDGSNRHLSCSVEMNRTCLYLPGHELQNRLFLWERHGSGLPNYPFSLYHGAVSRRLMERIKTRFNGRHFENPVPDIEYGLKLAVTAEHFAFCERPFSIAGICPESNGYSAGNIRKIKDIQEKFARELGRMHEQDSYLSDFPFPSYLGNSVILAQVHIWFRKTYGIRADGWQKNFAEACADSCLMMGSEDDYRIMVDGFRTAFSQWEEGRHLSSFQPKDFFARTSDVPFFGVWRYSQPGLNSETSFMHIAADVNEAQTPAAFFDILRSIISPVEDLDFHANTGINASPRKMTA